MSYNGSKWKKKEVWKRISLKITEADYQDLCLKAEAENITVHGLLVKMVKYIIK